MIKYSHAEELIYKTKYKESLSKILMSIVTLTLVYYPKIY